MQNQLGDIVFVDIPTVGEELNAGDVFGTIRSENHIRLVHAGGRNHLGTEWSARTNLNWLIGIPTVPDGLLDRPSADADFSVFTDAKEYKNH